MNILQVIPRFNPKLGGGVNVVYNISKYLSNKGHNITIITTDYKFSSEHSDEIKKFGVKVIPFKSLFNFHLFIPSPKMKKWLYDNIESFDIIHLNGARSYQNNIIYRYGKKFDIPYVLQSHGSILRIIEIKTIKMIYDLVWGYKIFRDASKVFALTQSEAKSCESMGIDEKNIEIIPNGVDIDEFKSLPKKGEFRKKLSINEKDKIILYLGRIHKSKGLDLLLHSFYELDKDLKNSKLLMVGPDDGYQKYLEKIANKLNIQDKIIYTGHVTEEEKKMAFVDSDVFVTPRFYGFPITFTESLACGLPIITTNEGDNIDWINNNVGYISKFNKNDLKDSIYKILNNEKIKIKFIRNSKNIVNNKLNWDIISEKILRIYSDIISN